jgi:hypothetical protein
MCLQARRLAAVSDHYRIQKQLPADHGPMVTQLPQLQEDIGPQPRQLGIEQLRHAISALCRLKEKYLLFMASQSISIHNASSASTVVRVSSLLRFDSSQLQSVMSESTELGAVLVAKISLKSKVKQWLKMVTRE